MFYYTLNVSPRGAISKTSMKKQRMEQSIEQLTGGWGVSKVTPIRACNFKCAKNFFPPLGQKDTTMDAIPTTKNPKRRIAEEYRR